MTTPPVTQPVSRWVTRTLVDQVNENFAAIDAWSVTADAGIHGANFPKSTGSLVERALVDRLAEERNVLDFGADPTGNADTVPALVAAQAALPSTGGIIRIPPGLYRMDSGFAVTKTGVSIVGGGWGNTVLIPHSDFGTAMIDLQGYSQTASGLQINAEQGAISVTGSASNGGLIRLAVTSTSQWTTGQKVFVDAVTGTIEANGEWTITVIDGTHIDLQGSAYVNAWVSGGAVLRYINVQGIKTSGVSAANIIVSDVFICGVGVGLWTAGCNDGRFLRLRVLSCAIGVMEGSGGAGVYASELHFMSVAVIPFGQIGLAWVIDYNAFSNQHETITSQGASVGITIESTQAHNGTTIHRPNGHYFGGDCNIDHAQLAACSITAGWNIVFLGGTLSGTQAGPGLLVHRSSATVHDLDGIECRGVYIGGNATHGVQLGIGCNARFVNNRIYGNSAVSAGTYNGIDVAADWFGQLEILVNMFGPSAASSGGWGGLLTAEAHGIVLATNSLTDKSDYMVGGYTLKGRLHIEANTPSSHGTSFMTDASHPTGIYKYIGAGQNASIAPVAITLTGSPFTYTAGGSPETVYITAGTVSAIAVGGVNLFTATEKTVQLQPGQAVVVTYTVQPTMNKYIQ